MLTDREVDRLCARLKNCEETARKCRGTIRDIKRILKQEGFDKGQTAFRTQQNTVLFTEHSAGRFDLQLFKAQQRAAYEAYCKPHTRVEVSVI